MSLPVKLVPRELIRLVGSTLHLISIGSTYGQAARQSRGRILSATGYGDVRTLVERTTEGQGFRGFRFGVCRICERCSVTLWSAHGDAKRIRRWVVAPGSSSRHEEVTPDRGRTSVRYG